MVFIHDHVGLGWGLSIIGLTVVVRAVLAAADAASSSSRCRRSSGSQPEIKKLQAKYKDDKQRLQQEMMKFYQENKVNPLGLLPPAAAQLPVFISLFYMLRKDLQAATSARGSSSTRQTRTSRQHVTCSQYSEATAACARRLELPRSSPT